MDQEQFLGDSSILLDLKGRIQFREVERIKGSTLSKRNRLSENSDPNTKSISLDGRIFLKEKMKIKLEKMIMLQGIPFFLLNKLRVKEKDILFILECLE